MVELVINVYLVAQKILQQRAQIVSTPIHPEDREIMTLFVGGVDAEVLTEKDLNDHFYAYGEIRNIRVMPKANCAFVTYSTRDAAERAIEALWNTKLSIKALSLKVTWAKPQQKQQQTKTASLVSASGATPSAALYPSMDPNLMGSRPEGLDVNK